ncbi:MAG: ABC transporter ATP-binding protein [Candidatus Caldatribacteriota bacterium]|nr:ABC transporter ATP-binding protein [Candidatus Caldatribacteriota bacterium]
MARIEFKNVSHSFEIAEGKEKLEWAVNDINIIWEDGVANALLGPSGCGKTTMLNIISGLLMPSEGKVYIDGKDVTELSTRERHIAQVFQFPVIYDSMNVYNNLAFPLVNAKVSSSKIRAKVEKIAEILGLVDYLEFPSSKLNSAEKQKVSLGRGIIRDDTVGILLDEPLTVIDPKMRGELRRQLKIIQRELNITAIYVTHDQHEALTFADEVAIMKDGRIVQVGSPHELYSDPESPFIGYFIGSPGMNILDGKLNKSNLSLKEFDIEFSKDFRDKIKIKNGECQLGIRPEAIITSKVKTKGTIPFEIIIVENMGSYKILTLIKKNESNRNLRIKSRTDIDMSVSKGETVYLKFPEEYLKIFKDNHKIY